MDFTLGLLGSLALAAGTAGWPYNLGQGYKNECDREIIVGVVDTGINDQTPGIRRNVRRNPLETLDGRDNDQNGLVDDVAGWDFAFNNNRPEDRNGHGTHISQIVLGNSNPRLATSLKCQPKIRIVPINYHTESWANLERSNSAFRYALNYPGMQIINYSSGGATESSEELALFRRLETAGIVVVVAAGNDGQDLTKVPYFPASYGFDNIVPVANCSKFGYLLPSSNYSGPTKFCSLGLSVEAQVKLKKFVSLSGTSQSAPFVTRALAILMSENRTWTAKDALRRLCAAASPLKGTTCGYMDLEKALKK